MTSFEMQKNIKRNSARCNGCGDEIESTHRHDFKSCSCGAVFVDGGHDYIRRGWKGTGPGFVDTSIYDVYLFESTDEPLVWNETYLRTESPDG